MEILYLHPVSQTTASGDAKTWQLIFPESTSRPELVSVVNSDPKRTFDLLEALEIDPIDGDTTPTQSTRNTQEFDMAEFSDNVDQLIKETDEAFQAVGLALADAKAAIPERLEKSANSPLRTTAMPRESPGKKRSIPNLTTKMPIARSSSVVKSKRQPFHLRKTKQPSRVWSRNASPDSMTSERWTLTDVTSNLVDVFSGKVFRTEVDEMLTPGRRQLLRDTEIGTSRKLSSVSKASVESDNSTPTEPFHLESLSASIDALAHVSHTIWPDPSVPPPPVPKKSEARKRRPPFVNNGNGMVFEDLNFPSPPRKLFPRKPSPLRQKSLPTILESSSSTLVPARSHRTGESSGNASPESMQNSAVLRSTPYTLTSPLLKHGPIRIDRKKANPLEEDALDWTAFQMAILGTMDNDPNDSLERDPNEAELDDITDWFSSFGFGGPGALIREPLNSPKLEIFVKVGNEKRKPWQGRFSDEKMLIAGDLKESLAWGLRLKDGESLPSSSMRHMIDMSPTGAGKVEPIIPMGYNLRHDLGDFLSWEAQHVQTFHDAS